MGDLAMLRTQLEPLEVIYDVLVKAIDISPSQK